MSTKKKIINIDQINWGIRVSTDKKFGKGHLSRCLQLSKHLGEKVTFFIDPFTLLTGYSIIREKNFNGADKSIEALRFRKIDFLIIDNYNIKKEIIDKISDIGNVIVFDDFKRKWIKPIVIGSGLSKYISSKKSKIIQGPKYAIVHKIFNKNRNIFKKNLLKNNARKIFIHVGANDSSNSISKILECLKPFHEVIDKITVVLFKSAPHYENVANSLKFFKNYELTSFKSMESLIKVYCENNYFIGAAGVSCLERISLSVYALTFSISKNQELNASNIKKMKLGHYGGNIHKISRFNLQKIIKEYILNEKFAKKTIIKKVIDGKGPERVVNRIKFLIKNA